MTIVKNSVMLLKTQKNDDEIDKYEELLKENNFRVLNLNTLIFKFHNLDNLAHKIKNTNYHGFIFSSPRCVEAVYLALNEQKLDDLWKHKNNYAVGEATSKAALHKLGIECKGKESGNAKNLAKVIMEEYTDDGCPFLFPHGNLKTDTLKREFEGTLIKMDLVHVYDTLPNPNIENDIKEATDNYTKLSEFVVYFSPSGVHSSIDHLRNFSELNNVKFIAIGPVTEEAMEKENLKIKAADSIDRLVARVL